MKSSTKQKLAMAVLNIAARYLKNRLQPAELPAVSEKVKIIYPDGRVEEIECKPVQRKSK